MTEKHHMSPQLVTFAVALLPALGGCRSPGDSADQATDRPLAVVVSADTQGWIMPCGCASNQSGGLPRRATYIDRARQTADVIVADVGGAPGGTFRYDRVKFAAILAGEAAMGMAAHNLGEGEIRLGTDELRPLAKETGVPFVSANVVDSDGRPIAEPVRVITVGRRRVALVGVASERYAAGGARVADPRAAVVEALARRHGQYDAVVVLAYAPTEELTALAEQLPEADVVVGGPTLQSIQPRLSGPKTLLASVTNKGKFLARFDAPRASSSEPWHGEIVEVDAQLADDRAQLANLERYQRELAQLDLSAAETGFGGALGLGAAADYRIADSGACLGCHQRDSQVWEHSRHAEAWHTLVDRGWHVDSLCQQCHTTGFGLLGGFASARRTPELGSVGCESCHGPSHAHATEPARHRTTFAARDCCAQCHDRENSPNFALASYWKQIEHGARRAAGEESNSAGAAQK